MVAAIGEGPEKLHGLLEIGPVRGRSGFQGGHLLLEGVQGLENEFMLLLEHLGWRPAVAMVMIVG